MGIESSKLDLSLSENKLKPVDIFDNDFTDVKDTEDAIAVPKDKEAKYGMDSYVNLQNCSKIKLISSIKAATRKELDLHNYNYKLKYPALAKFKNVTIAISNKVSIHRKGFTTEKIETERFLTAPRKCPKLVKTISSTEFDQCDYSLSSSSTNEIVEDEGGVIVCIEEGLNDECSLADFEPEKKKKGGKEYRKMKSAKTAAVVAKGKAYSDATGQGKRLTPLLFSQSSISNDICRDINKPYYVKTHEL